jgi:hypothetical protein
VFSNGRDYSHRWNAPTVEADRRNFPICPAVPQREEHYQSLREVDYLVFLSRAEYDATPYDAKPSEILVDIIGLGAGVYDRCRELGLPVRGINVARRQLQETTACASAMSCGSRVANGFRTRHAQCRMTMP